MKKNILIFVSGMLFMLIVGVSANILYSASDIEFKSDNSDVTNVQDALEEVYNMDKGYNYKVINCGKKDTTFTLENANKTFMTCTDPNNTSDVVYSKPIVNYVYSGGGCPLYFSSSKSNNIYSLLIHSDTTCSGRIYISDLQMLLIYKNK